MDMEKLGYYLYMEACEAAEEDPEELTEDEKFNVKINPFLVEDQTTKEQE